MKEFQRKHKKDMTSNKKGLSDGLELLARGQRGLCLLLLKLTLKLILCLKESTSTQALPGLVLKNSVPISSVVLWNQLKSLLEMPRWTSLPFMISFWLEDPPGFQRSKS